MKLKLTDQERDRLKICYIFEKTPIFFSINTNTQIELKKIKPNLRDLLEFLSGHCVFFGKKTRFFGKEFQYKSEPIINCLYFYKYLSRILVGSLRVKCQERFQILLNIYSFYCYTAPNIPDAKTLDANLIISEKIQELKSILSTKTQVHNMLSAYQVSQLIANIRHYYLFNQLNSEEEEKYFRDLKYLADHLFVNIFNNNCLSFYEYSLVNIAWMLEKIAINIKNVQELSALYERIMNKLLAKRVTVLGRIEAVSFYNQLTSNGICNIDYSYDRWILADPNVKFLNIREIIYAGECRVFFNQNYGIGDIVFAIDSMKGRANNLSFYLPSRLALDSLSLASYVRLDESLTTNMLLPIGFPSDFNISNATQDSKIEPIFKASNSSILEEINFRNTVLVTPASSNIKKNEFIPLSLLIEIIGSIRRNGKLAVLWQNDLDRIELNYYDGNNIENLFDNVIPSKYVSNFESMSNVLRVCRGLIAVSGASFILSKHLATPSFLITNTFRNKYLIKYLDIKSQLTDWGNIYDVDIKNKVNLFLEKL